MNASSATPIDTSLSAELLTAVDALSRRRADLLDETKVEQFVRQGWLSWKGGALKVTPVGARVCDAVLLAYA